MKKLSKTFYALLILALSVIGPPAASAQHLSDLMAGMFVPADGGGYAINVTPVAAGGGQISGNLNDRWMGAFTTCSGSPCLRVSGAGGVSDGDKGDITISGSGATYTIDNGVVTEAKQLLSDNTTNDVSTTKHGYAPKGDGDTTKFLNANGAYSTPAGGTSSMSRIFLMR